MAGTLRVAVLMFLTLIATVSPGGAGARIVDIIVTQSDEYLVVFARLKEAFIQDIEESIINGVPTTFTYQLRLMRRRALFPDATVATLTVKQRVAYDLLADEFQFAQDDGTRGRTRVTKSYAEVQKWMAGLDGVRIAPRRLLEAGELYYVRIKAEIRSVSLIFPLNYLLFFISFFNFDTPWESSSLFRVSR